MTNAIGQIRNELSQFSNQISVNENTAVDLGGAFTPVDESVVQTWNTTDDPAGLLSEPCLMLKGDWIHLDTYHLTLFLDSLRSHTCINSIGCKLKASGIFRLVIRGVSQNENKVLREKVIHCVDNTEFSASEQTITKEGIEKFEKSTRPLDREGPWISTKGFKHGFRLTASIECLSELGIVSGFRWQGKGPAANINSGQRIYLLRTFGNSELVAETLGRLSERVEGDSNLNGFASRSVFIVYDATGKDQSTLFSKAASTLRVLYTKGGNYGGGGNASFLAEMARQAADGLSTVDEVILIDDDAGIDPEVFIRHDSYVSLRLPNVFTSAVVFAKANPLCIQEWGGYWGRFFSELSERPTKPQQNKDQLKLYPYLVRHGQNIKDPNHLNNLAQSIGVDFSTFIFISFPFKALNEIGGILPVFLRNDDVDLSLRLRNKSYRLAINSNLFAYHDSGHNLTGEFFALFHALIVNSAYAGLNLENIQRFFARRLSSTLANRNLVLLRVYEQVLKAFLMGPSFMEPETVYPRYKDLMRKVSHWQSTILKQIPNEVVDELKSRDEVDVRILLDPLAPTPSSSRGEVIFVDPNKDGYFSSDLDETDQQLPITAQSVLEALAETGTRLECLAEEWAQWVHKFDARKFWGNEAKAYQVVDESIKTREAIRHFQHVQESTINSENQEKPTINIVRTHRGWIMQRISEDNESQALRNETQKGKSSFSPNESTSTNQPVLVNAPTATDLIRQDKDISAGAKDKASKQSPGARLISILMPGKQPRVNGHVLESSAQATITMKEFDEEDLPYGFNEERYLRLNPDVRESKMTGKVHYLRYGRYEHRQY